LTTDGESEEATALSLGGQGEQRMSLHRAGGALMEGGKLCYHNLLLTAIYFTLSYADIGSMMHKKSVTKQKEKK